MEEEKLLRRVQRGSQRALGEIIQTYSAYVVTVIENRGRGLLPPEDVEELASDVFYALWQKAGQVTNLKAWLSRVARNKAVDRLRQRKYTVPLEERTAAQEDEMWDLLAMKEQSRLVRQALSRLSPEDQEIFYRYYDLSETTNTISEAMGLNPATVRTRLRRGREALRKTLCLRGYLDETDN